MLKLKIKKPPKKILYHLKMEIHISLLYKILFFKINHSKFSINISIYFKYIIIVKHGLLAKTKLWSNKKSKSSFV